MLPELMQLAPMATAAMRHEDMAMLREDTPQRPVADRKAITAAVAQPLPLVPACPTGAEAIAASFSKLAVDTLIGRQLR
jgi:hypothetical protein